MEIRPDWLYGASAFAALMLTILRGFAVMISKLTRIEMTVEADSKKLAVVEERVRALETAHSRR